MSDYSAASLPIRSDSDGTDQKVVVKIVDGTVGGSNQVSVDSDKNAHVELHVNDPAGVDRVVKSSEDGNIALEGKYDASLNSVPSSVSMVVAARATTPALSDLTKRLTGISNGTVHSLDVAIRDELGVPFSETNPMPVIVTESEGAEVNDYKSASAIAAAGSDNHDYTVTALTTLYLTQIEAAASGKCKMLVQIETAAASGTFTTRWVKFNSVSNPSMSITLKEPITVAAGVKVRVVMTNLDNQAQDLYSTISGHEV